MTPFFLNYLEMRSSFALKFPIPYFMQKVTELFFLVKKCNFMTLQTPVHCRKTIFYFFAFLGSCNLGHKATEPWKRKRQLHFFI